KPREQARHARGPHQRVNEESSVRAQRTTPDNHPVRAATERKRQNHVGHNRELGAMRLRVRHARATSVRLEKQRLYTSNNLAGRWRETIPESIFRYLKNVKKTTREKVQSRRR